MRTIPHIRIFLSSPNDVTAERVIAREVLAALNDDPFITSRATVEALAWEAPASRVLMPVALTPQQAIDRKLARPSETDAVIVILWGRMGTPLDVTAHGLKPDGTPYLSGTEWEYLDARKGAAQHPDKLPIVLVYRRTDTPPHPTGDDLDALSEWVTQRKRVQAFFKPFRDSVTGAYRANVNEYSSPDDFRAQFTQDARLLVKELLELYSAPDTVPAPEAFPEAPPKIQWTGSPFPGLRAFSEDDEPIFFGRGTETADLIKRLSQQQIMFVIGASGSGKSSLVSAGVIPMLKRGALADVAGWHLVRMTPAWDPFEQLRHALLTSLPDTDPPPTLILRQSPEAWTQYAETALATDPDGMAILLFIDQFEELFTITPEAARAPFASLLSAASPQIRVIVTMRSDFYDQALPYFEAILRDASFTLGAPSPIALYQMITRPAEVTGLTFEDGLAEEIVAQTSGQAGALALMAYTLDELYTTSGAHRQLTRAAYEALGGVEGAIGRRAEATFERLTATDKDRLFQQVFRELVTVDERGTATRQHAPLIIFDAAESDLIRAFVDARLLVTADERVEVAHEAVFRSWERLTTWIAEAQEDLILLRQVRAAADEWDRKGRPNFLRWQSERLKPVTDMIARQQPSMTPCERAFIEPEAERLLHELDSLATAHQRRRDIGERLATIGDPRTGIGVNANGLPQIDWMAVTPEGDLDIRGSRFPIKPFYVARYLITFPQFEAFLMAPDGFEDERWWKHLPAAYSKHKMATAAAQYPNTPRDTVSWYQAVAFTAWLDFKIREIGGFSRFVVETHNGTSALGLNPRHWQIRLPTEWEWQWMAQNGTEARKYPWGAWDDQPRANTSEAGIAERSTAVGMYPAGQAACGALDVAGNLAEWCLNSYEDFEVATVDPKKQRSVRGGALNYFRNRAATDHRGRFTPGDSHVGIGLRVVMAALLGIAKGKQ